MYLNPQQSHRQTDIHVHFQIADRNTIINNQMEIIYVTLFT